MSFADSARFSAHEIVEVCVTLSAAEASLAAQGCHGIAADVASVFELMESRLLA